MNIKSAVFVWIFFILALPVKAQYEYQNQSITITNVDVRKNEVRAGVQGVQLTCYAVFKYGDNEISGAMENDYLRQYYFFLEIKRADNNDRIFFPEHNPDQENKESTFDEYFKVRVTSAGKYYVRIFIPYHHFELNPGFQKVNISLSACDEKSKFYFRNLYQTDMIIEQPTTYLARIRVDRIKLVDKKYDMPATKIPFFGLFVGGKKSKAGQGLPDAAWKVMVGNDIIYESTPNKDALEVVPGTATFKIAKGDPVKLIVYDEDYFKSDQILGTVNYYLTSEPGTEIKNNYAFESVESSDIVFEKTVIPAISSSVTNYKVIQRDSITGIEVTVVYHMEGLSPDDGIIIRPVFRDKNGKIYVPDYIKLTEANMELNNQGQLVDRRNGTDKYSFFVPHYACFPDMYPGVQFIMDDFNEEVQTSFSPQKLEDFGVIRNDVKIYTGASIEDNYRGYWGLKFPLIIDIPSTYYDDLKYSDVLNSVRIFVDDTMEITNRVQLVSMFGDTALGSFHMRKLRHDKIVHVPYSALNLSNQPHRITLFTSSVCLKNNRIINQDTIILQVENPNLLPLKPFRVKFHIRDKKYEKGFLRVYRGNTLLSTYSVSDIDKGRTYLFSVNEPGYLFHINDEVRIEAVGVDYFGVEKVLDKTILGPLQLNYHIIPDRKRSKTVSGYRILRPKKVKP